MATIAENLEHVREQIAQAAAKVGRTTDDVELVAISKTHEAAKVREAVEAGQSLFGESRVQEARVLAGYGQEIEVDGYDLVGSPGIQKIIDAADRRIDAGAGIGHEEFWQKGLTLR